MSQTESAKAVQRQERVTLYRQQHIAANRWAAGYGAIQHTLEMQDHVFTMAEWLTARGCPGRSGATADAARGDLPSGAR